MKHTVTIKRNNDFSKLYRKGKFSSGKFLTLYLLPNKRDFKRLGITAGRKVGKSVKRNRLKRLVRENYRQFEEYITSSCDIIILIRQNDILPSFWDIRKELKYHLNKLGVFDKEKWNLEKSLS